LGRDTVSRAASASQMGRFETDAMGPVHLGNVR